MIAQHDCAEQARQIVALLPILRRWVTDCVARAGAEQDLSLRQYAALKGICDGATTPGELARRWQVTPAVITGIIDRLERRNLVVRQIDPSDRRRLRLSLTPAGLAASQEIDRALTGDLADQLATSSPGELSELGRSLHLLERTLVALDARTGLQGPPSAVHDMPAWSQNEPDVEIPGRALANSRN